MLSAQDSDPLVPLHRMSSSKAEMSILVDPAVLVRLPSGWWGRHTGTDLPRLIDALDPDIVCEQELKTRLVDRLYEAKRSLNLGTLAMKSIHAEWFWNQRKVEKWLAAKEIALEDMEQSTVERMKMVELAYARSSENRINTLSAIITRNECPDVNEPPPITGSRLERDILRKKRIKDLSFEDMLELHPVKGWVRSDMMAHLKGLYASTIASRLLADPTSFNLFNLYMKKCAFRTSDIAVPAPPPFSEEDIGISQDDFEALEELEEELSAPRPNTFYSSSTHARVKPVEQLDLVTGAVVRRYPSGKDAAAIMKVGCLFFFLNPLVLIRLTF